MGSNTQGCLAHQQAPQQAGQPPHVERAPVGLAREGAGAAHGDGEPVAEQQVGAFAEQAQRQRCASGQTEHVDQGFVGRRDPGAAGERAPGDHAGRRALGASGTTASASRVCSHGW